MNYELLSGRWRVHWEIDRTVRNPKFAFGHELRLKRAFIVHGGKALAQVHPVANARDVAILMAQAPSLARAVVDAVERLKNAKHPNAVALRDMLEAALQEPEETD